MTDQRSTSTPAFLLAIWAAILVTVFVAFRNTDLLRLLLGNLGSGPLFGNSIGYSLAGCLIAGLIGIAWFGIGSTILPRPFVLNNLQAVVMSTATGSAVFSLLWFFFGLAGWYDSIAAVVFVVGGLAIPVGLAIGLFLKDGKKPEQDSRLAGFDWFLVIAIAIPVLLALVTSIAPPTAKDTLLYHFSVPKAFIAQGGNALVEGNMASYLALGTEMHVVWAMLLGGLLSPRTAEAAAGAATFLFFPLLLLTTFSWAREIDITRRWALIATLSIAAIPTAYYVASSGYVDLALALFITLAIRSLCQWWRLQNRQSIILIALFLGAALSIKLTTVFVIAAFALIILLKARGVENAGRIAAGGFAALVLAGVFASPWYVRTWAATGSPVFPFYMSIWKGAAEGWDVERSNLFQAMTSQYGGADLNPVNYLTAPLRVSVAAQPEVPSLYDGVLGPAFLIGLPLLIWAFWKREVAVEAKIAAGVAGVMFLFWLFSSQQLRYLLPIVPALAVAIAASVEALSGGHDALNKAARFSLAGASLVCVATSFAWFCQRSPLRVVLGGEARDQYLTRNLDYYPYYQMINSDTRAEAKVWLINMRRDTYNIDRPVFADYIFEDWTLGKMVWESQNVEELKAKAAALGIQYVLTRHDFLFDFDRSTLVDEKKTRGENEVKLKMAKEFILDPANTLRADDKFSLIKVF